MVGDFAIITALGLFQKIIVRFPISMCAKKWNFVFFSNYQHVALFACGAINRIKLILFAFNPNNGVFTSEPPFVCKIAYMSYVLMRTVVVGLIDTSYLVFWHNYPFCFDLIYSIEPTFYTRFQYPSSIKDLLHLRSPCATIVPCIKYKKNCSNYQKRKTWPR
jgi:hypothetical protein